MKISQMFAGIVLSITSLVALGADSTSSQKLQNGDYVAVVGDSITEQKQYSVFIEDYLTMCRPALDLRTTQFGWSGETSWGFAKRMANDMLRFHCTVATINFGMNDGGYSAETPEKEKHYHDAYTSVVEQMKKGGVRFIVVGSPGCVDTARFGRDPAVAAMYNKTLATERDIARKIAEEQGVAFADVFDPMTHVMEKAEAKYGGLYTVAGNDGVHPDANGHLVMAYAYLKSLGCDGNIGTITVNLPAGKADATDGHVIVSFKDGMVNVQSSRYPFCFFGNDLKSTSSTRGVLEFLPFNADLNRFTLIVTHAPAGKKVNITWGKQSKTFSAEELSKGINLAAEFLDNPFCQPFQQVEQAIRLQQDFETPLVKQSINSLPLTKDEATVARTVASLVEQDRSKIDASNAAVKPVTHSIKIEVEQ